MPNPCRTSGRAAIASDDAIEGAFGLIVGAADDGTGFLHGSFKAERLVHEIQVVVDGLGDADDRNGQVAFFEFDGDVVGAALGAVATDGEEDVDVETVEGADDFLGGLLAAG